MRALVLFLSGLLGLATAHVRLTFPPARKYDFDFLDNVRTAGPCGMESDGTVVTELPKGAIFDVTWHLAYAHRGGFRLELWKLGSNEIIYLAGAENAFINDDDITTTSYEVQIPADFAGEGVLRLRRHAREWATGGGGQYIFWSCADINVTSDFSDCGEGCSADDCVMGKCTACPHLSSGDFCQYTDDCETSNDCDDHGECWKVSDKTYPQNQCFCEEGWFGPNCKKENPSDFSVDIDKSKFSMRDLTDDLKLYYLIRAAEEEVEIAIEADSTTWVALGWKPSNLARSCQNFPVQYSSGQGNTNPLAEPESEPEATSQPPPYRRRRAIQLMSSLQEEDNLFFTSDYQCVQGGWSGPGAEPEGTGEPEPEPSAEPEAEPEGTAEPEAEPEGTAEPDASAEPEAEPEGTGEPEPEGTGEPEGEPTGQSNLHPMDCMDVVIGRAKGRFGNVGDYYTRDRSTPRLDAEFYGGTNDLIAAGAKEMDGVTTVVFRRKLTTADRADHDIVQGGMDVIWARGQELGQEFHRPPSGLESCEAGLPTDYNFYLKDDVKYHGGHANQRGSVRGLDFFVDPNDGTLQAGSGCNQTLMEGCSGSACDYVIKWTHRDEGAIRFTITARTDMDKWTGVAFSPRGAMVGSDAVLAWHDGTEGFVKDYFLGGKGPNGVVEDDISDIEDVSVTYENGMLQVSFTRQPDTGDTDQDVSLNPDNCVFLLLPLNGGAYDGGRAGYHSQTPISTSTKICFRCGEQAQATTDVEGLENDLDGSLKMGTTACPEDAGCGADAILPSLLLTSLIGLAVKLILG